MDENEKKQEEAKREAEEKAAKEKSEVEQRKKESAERTENKKSVLEEAKETAERIEKANEKMEANINKLQDLQARELLGGRADAGGIEKVKTDDEKWEESAKERYAGTGMSPIPDKE